MINKNGLKEQYLRIVKMFDFTIRTPGTSLKGGYHYSNSEGPDSIVQNFSEPEMPH